MTKRKGETVSFGSSVKAEGGVKQGQPKPLTVEQKLDNLTQDIVNQLNQHANALNAIAFWIARQDPEVEKEVNVVQWCHKVLKEEQELQERMKEWNKKNG